MGNFERARSAPHQYVTDHSIQSDNLELEPRPQGDRTWRRVTYALNGENNRSENFKYIG
ncbi:hypothetical protein JJD41_22510 [Oxynema sp. CENA135]|uniref:hypothetical protein n=1 Tax=Oxynema sp. CENA135 TaxID=984206 RepID=UPI00190CB3EA|nr:hypothetical protein [Oxynema sp. CENA135]MBK4732616.1 hypothetical protein [Oxynema sp. CENA135]